MTDDLDTPTPAPTPAPEVAPDPITEPVVEETPPTPLHDPKVAQMPEPEPELLAETVTEIRTATRSHLDGRPGDHAMPEREPVPFTDPPIYRMTGNTLFFDAGGERLA